MYLFFFLTSHVSLFEVKFQSFSIFLFLLLFGCGFIEIVIIIVCAFVPVKNKLKKWVHHERYLSSYRMPVPLYENHVV